MKDIGIRELRRVLGDPEVVSMRGALRALGLNPSSSSASTRARLIARAADIDISRFRSGVRQNLSGKKFGFLTVVGLAGKQPCKLGRFWICRCVCGNCVERTAAALNSGKAKHCGCRSYMKGEHSRRWTGAGPVSGKLWSQVKRNARVRGLAVELTVEQALEVFNRQGGLCAISGTPIKFQDRTASLDRIDSDRPYTLENVQWTHKTVNLMKQSLSDIELVDWCLKIASYEQARQKSSRH